MTKSELLDELCMKLAENLETISYTHPKSRRRKELQQKHIQLVKEIRACEKYSCDWDETLPDCLFID